MWVLAENNLFIDIGFLYLTASLCETARLGLSVSVVQYVAHLRIVLFKCSKGYSGNSASLPAWGAILRSEGGDEEVLHGLAFFVCHAAWAASACICGLRWLPAGRRRVLLLALMMPGAPGERFERNRLLLANQFAGFDLNSLQRQQALAGRSNLRVMRLSSQVTRTPPCRAGWTPRASALGPSIDCILARQITAHPESGG
jgi:hypothetical protein